MYEIRKIELSDEELRSYAFNIRNEVFVREQNVDPALEYDSYEKESIHYLAFDNNIAVATARWRYTEKGIKLERFATLKEYRNKGIGNRIFSKVLEDVIPFNKPIYLHSQITAIKFYERRGFKTFGNKFVEAGIDHYMMRYER